MNKNIRGIGWWTLGSATLALGFAFNYLRDAPVIGMIAVVANNALFVAGLLMLYKGILQFLNKPERNVLVFTFLVLFIVIIIFFTFFYNSIVVRRGGYFLSHILVGIGSKFSFSIPVVQENVE